MRRSLTWMLAGAALVTPVLVGLSTIGTSAAPRARSLDPSNFTHPVANAYFPLTPGLALRYRGTDGGQRFRERVAVTRRTKKVDGIQANIVRDVLRRADGSVAEKTRDWYADDNSGNVWYVGENTATYDRDGNRKSRAGSWQAGVKGAVAGLIMPASPKPTDAYRQEFWPGHAEDQAWVVQNGAKVQVPLGTYRHVVRSYEWSRLERHNVSVKFYARGLGIIGEHDVLGGTEKFQLVHVTRP